ncbi:hypothetical protein [Streptomyces sp. ME18-1-4]|uniref:hypothetical protein n=1 Tax=Streptomyces sp. ME18-1-4 TaxID=3028685 RepID=UPI0029BD29C1|nr:hypothetical protein [Streptomyces sp. ME18-1-4]MDX3249452.1 hypothetical protein [Streptomyces sp. ME18-1-4]
MTTAVDASRRATVGRPGPLPRAWGTARTVLRVHRAALVVWAGLVVVLCGWLVWATEAAARDARAAAEACDRAGQDLCDSAIDWVGHSASVDWIGLLTSYLFLAVAAYEGGALVGRELESGTARLAWTQGVSPARWLAAKLAVPALVVTVGATALVLVYRWAWSATQDPQYHGWMSDDAYLSRGPATVAYALCALAVGAVTALLIRRALPALAVSVAATGLLGYIVAQLRASFWPAVTITASPEELDYPASAWVVESGAVVHGRHVRDLDVTRCYGGSTARTQGCLDDLGVQGSYLTYHPESHYWPLHLVETGIVLAVTAAVTAAAFWLLRRRTA